MEKESLQRELDNHLREFFWTYIFEEDGESVQFINAKIGSMEERSFLRSLREDGSEYVFTGKGKVNYKISRNESNLWLTGMVNGEKVEDKQQIEEREAVQVFREKKGGGESGILGDIFEFLGRDKKEVKKRLVPNNLDIRIDQIDGISMNREGKVDFLKLTGEGFSIELKRNGGLRVSLP